MGWFKKIFGGSKRSRSCQVGTYYEERAKTPDQSDSLKDEARSPQRAAEDDGNGKSSYNPNAEYGEYSYNHNNGYDYGFQYPSNNGNYDDGTQLGYQEYESSNREQYGNWFTDLWNHYSNLPQSGNETSAPEYHDPYYGDQGSNLYGDPHYGDQGSNLYGDPYDGHIGTSSFGYSKPSYDDRGNAGFSREQGDYTSRYPTYYGEQGWNHPSCYVCQNTISQGYSSSSHLFWRQLYCHSHEYDGTPMCKSCQRFKPSDEKYKKLVDGRFTCLDCRKTAIMDREACRELYCEAKRFYKRHGMEIDSYIPVYLVDDNEMARFCPPSGYVTGAQGMCVRFEDTVETIITADDVAVRTRTQDLDGDGVVKGILIVYGQPRLQTGTVIVHELMHAWFKLEGYPELSKEVEEGMAQVMAYLWLSSEMDSSNVRGWLERFGEYLKCQITMTEMPNYGSGYRRGISAVGKYGLERTLARIRSTGEIPW